MEPVPKHLSPDKVLDQVVIFGHKSGSHIRGLRASGASSARAKDFGFWDRGGSRGKVVTPPETLPRRPPKRRRFDDVTMLHYQV